MPASIIYAIFAAACIGLLVWNLLRFLGAGLGAPLY
jgi:hypothetical protein